MEVNGQLQASAALPQGKEPPIPLDRRLGGPQSRAGRSDEEEKSHHWACRELNPGRPARSLITILTELPLLQFIPSTHWTGGWVGPRVGLDVIAKRNKIPPPAGNRTPDTLIENKFCSCSIAAWKRLYIQDAGHSYNVICGGAGKVGIWIASVRLEAQFTAQQHLTRRPTPQF
jgi:hypothetical protein